MQALPKMCETRCPASELITATASSAVLDLAFSQPVLLLLTAVALIPIGVWGPLGAGVHTLLIGHSSTTRMVLFVLPGVINSASHSEIQIMAWTPVPPCYAPEGQQLAQLIPFYSASPPGKEKRGSAAFGSTGMPQILWAKTISSSQAMMMCSIDGDQFRGLVDTGADVSIIKDGEWPADWSTVFSAVTIQRISGMQRPRQSAQLRTVLRPEGQAAPIPCTLWRTVWTTNDMFARLIIKGREHFQMMDEEDLEVIYIPATKDNLDWLLAEDAGFQAALVDYMGDLSVHFPKHWLGAEIGNLPLLAAH
ncbi:hypothetical protein WISP_59192 [Willisornis vidua]|uniref:Peptidase A2 domain-containing protein n=1 Tax=Willisornis vidua TaxID=1566151 RepID=A0ABQ9DBQ6_9PASS|nr:hypothetical protein WISP_59192 [Willisornis vidua]